MRASPLLFFALIACGTTSEPAGSATQEPLCEGSPGLRFAASSAGGNLGGTPRIASEVGWSFLIVDGHCHYWSMTKPDAPIREGTLSEEDSATLSHDLKLGRWGGQKASDYCSDAPSLTFRFGNETLLLTGCPSSPLSDAYEAWTTQLYDAGTDLASDVRYTLIDATEDGWVVGDNLDMALWWPLASDPVDLARPPDEIQSVEPLIAEGSDAAALRELRAGYSDTSGIGPYLAIPVRSDHTYYFNLAMRDVTPFEVDGRLSPDDFFD